MSNYFLVGNCDKKKFVEVNRFTAVDYEAGAGVDYEAGAGKKPLSVSSQRIASVVIYLLATSDSFPAMGAWAKDQVIVARDGDLRTTMYEQMRESWEDVTENMVVDFLKTVEKSSEPFVLPVVRCPDCGASTARAYYGMTAQVTLIKCGMCGNRETIDAVGGQWSA